MRGRTLVCALALAMPATTFAQGADDIEMGGEEAPAEKPADAPPAVVKDPKAAKKWHQAGLQLVQKGDYATRKNKADDAKQFYENALTAFTKALEVGEDLNVHWDLALTLDKLGKFDEAAKQVRLINNTKTGIKADIVKKAAAKWDDLSTKIGVLTLTITTEETTVSLAGTELGMSPLKEPLILMPGTYTFSFASTGYQPKDVEVQVEAGSESERSIELDPIKIVVEPPTPDVDTPVAVVKPEPPSMLPVYFGGGITVAALAATIVTGMMARSEHDTFIAPDSTFDQREDARVRGQNLALTSDILLGGTVVAAGFTAYWYLFQYRPKLKKFRGEGQGPTVNAPNPDELSMSKVQVMPWVKGDAGGLSFAGSF